MVVPRNSDDPLSEDEIRKIRSAFHTHLEEFRLNPEVPYEDLDVDESGVLVTYYSEQASIIAGGSEHSTLFVNFAHILGTLDKDNREDLQRLDQAHDTLRLFLPYHFQELSEDLNEVAQAYLMQWETNHSDTTNVKGKRINVAIYNFAKPIKLRALRMGRLGNLLRFQGTVTRTTDVKSEVLRGFFTCMDCEIDIPRVPQEFKYTMPTICPRVNCNNKTRFRIDISQSALDDWQKVRVQEQPSELPNGSMPRSIDVYVRGDMVDVLRPGDRCDITGTLIVMPDISAINKFSDVPKVVRRELAKGSLGENALDSGIAGLKRLGVRGLTHRVGFLASFVEPLVNTTRHSVATDRISELFSRTSVEKRGSMHQSLLNPLEGLPESARRQVYNISKDPDCFENLARCIAPEIHGYTDIKKGILLMLVGGVEKVLPDDKMRLRGDINLCIVGDPATGKSQFLRFVSRIHPRCIFASGKASTAAGLTASVHRDAEAGDTVIEAGALLLADDGVCCIDEFDKMDGKDQVAIHEAMEQQTITISKAGIQATLNARASILASCAPAHGRYDWDKPFRHNVTISPPILSRFDLFFVMTDEANAEDDVLLAEHIVNRQRGKLTRPQYEEEIFEAYLRLARTIQPDVTARAARLLEERFVEMRKNDGGQGASSYRITVRQLESLLRCSEAVARLHLSQHVMGKHVNIAHSLIRDGIVQQSARVDVLLAAEDDVTEEEEGIPESGQDPERNKLQTMRVTRAELNKIGYRLGFYAEHNPGIKQMDLVSWYISTYELPDGRQLSKAEFEDVRRKINLIVNYLAAQEVLMEDLERENEDENTTRPQGTDCTSGDETQQQSGTAVGEAGGKRRHDHRRLRRHPNWDLTGAPFREAVPLMRGRRHGRPDDVEEDGDPGDAARSTAPRARRESLGSNLRARGRSNVAAGESVLSHIQRTPLPSSRRPEGTGSASPLSVKGSSRGMRTPKTPVLIVGDGGGTGEAPDVSDDPLLGRRQSLQVPQVTQRSRRSTTPQNPPPN